MGVASWSFDLAQAVVWVWAGRGCSSRKGWAADRVSWVCSRGVVGLSGAGMRDTPAAACWVVVGAPACVGVWGWHAVGVLGQCALVA